MPIIQISEIRHRRGLKQDLVSLDEGEIALTVDTGELFIGTPALPSIARDLIAPLWQSGVNYIIGDFVVESGIVYSANINHLSGATFAIANWDKVDLAVANNPNTKILTEWSNNIESILKYSYIDRNTRTNSDRSDNISFQEINDFYDDLPNTWPIQAIKKVGDTAYTEMGVRRYLQERLDERVSVLSYGATGNGREYLTNPIPTARFQNDMDAEANAIRRATIDLANYLADDASDGITNDTNKALYFPAGVYVVNKPLFLTNNTKWIGDGKGKTRIIFNVSTLTLSQLNNALLQTIGLDVGGNPISVTDVVDDTITPHHMYQNISQLVRNIDISGISFEIYGTMVPIGPTDPALADAVRLVRAENVVFHDCEFIGNWQEANIHVGPYDFTSDSQAFSIDSSGDSQTGAPSALIPKNIQFDHCDFSYFYYLTTLNDGMFGISVTNSHVSCMYKGAMIGEPDSSTTIWATYPSATNEYNAPRAIKVTNNLFSHIASTGLQVFRGYLGDGIFKSATYAGYASTEKLVGNLPFTQSMGVASMFNRWENVGNYDGGTVICNDTYLENPGIPVISFNSGTTYNMSIGETFARDIEVTPLNFNTVGRVFYDPADTNMIINPQDQSTIGGGGGAISIDDEGILVTATATSLNFIGAGVAATTGGGGIVDVTIPGRKYEISLFKNAPIAALSTIFVHSFTSNVIFNDNFLNSVGSVVTNPSAAYALDIQKNSVSIGTISISVAGAVSFSTIAVGTETFILGDKLQIIANAAVDATINGISITLVEQ